MLLVRGKRFCRVEGKWDGVIYIEEVMIGESNGVYVWRWFGKDWMFDCLFLGLLVKISLMIWVCIIWIIIFLC